MAAKKWTSETLAVEAKKYTTRGAFRKGSNGAYCVACNLRILDSICTHMETIARPAVTREEATNIASRFHSRSAFKAADVAAYTFARKGKFLDEICSHMIIKRRSRYTKQEISEIAKKYETRSEFQKSMSGAYTAAFNNDWLDEICQHMRRGKYGFDTQKSGWLYHLKLTLNHQTFVYKVGITNFDTETRIRQLCVPKTVKIEILQSIWFESGRDAKHAESEILAGARNRKISYDGEPFLESGNSELFWEPVM